MSQDVGDAQKGLLDRKFETLEKQMQIACWNKDGQEACDTMKKFGPATDNARVPCVLTIMNVHKNMTEHWKKMTPRDVFQYNNPNSKTEEGHSASKMRETEERLRKKGLADRKGCLHIVVKCRDCEAELATIRAKDTIESLYQDIQKLVVHDKRQPLIYDQISKLDPALPDDAAKVCELTHSVKVNAFVKELQRPEVLESIRDSLATGKLKEILKKKSEKAKDIYGDPLKTYIRIGLGFPDFGKFPSQPVLELWPQTYSSPIHQHGGCAGSVRVVHGKLACKFYQSLLSKEPMSFQKGDCGLNSLNPKPQEVLTLKAGETTWLNRQNWFVHAVECSNDASIKPLEFTLSIHFYKSCTDEFAFVADGAVKKGQPKNDLFWNCGLKKGHHHYLEHYEDENGEKILVPDFQKEVIGTSAAAQQEDPAQAKADEAEAEKCGSDIISAARDGLLGAVRHLLLTQPEAVAATDGFDSRTALHFAAGLGRVEFAQVLLAANAQVDSRDRNGQTPLDLARRNGHTEVVRLLEVRLLEEVDPADEAEAEKCGYSLHQAARDGLLGATRHILRTRPGAVDCRLLLAAGAPLDARDRFVGSTPLHWAAYEGKAELVKLLVEAKASVTVKANDGETPLDYARSHGHRAVVTILENAA